MANELERTPPEPAKKRELTPKITLPSNAFLGSPEAENEAIKWLAQIIADRAIERMQTDETT